MELDEFIKQDIQRFLDAQVAALHATAEPRARKEGVIAPEEVMLYAPTRDYVKELDEALAKRDIEAAKKIIYGFKEAYEQYEPNSPEWEEGKRLFKSLYLTFRKAMEEDERRQEELLRRELEQGLTIGNSPPPRTPSPTPPQQTTPPQTSAPQTTTQAAPQRPAPRALVQKTAPPPDFWRRLDAYAREAQTPGPERPAMPPEQEALLAQRISAIEAQLQRGAPHDALAAYKALTNELAPEQLSREQRAKYLPRLLALYRRIHAAIEQLRRSEEEFLAALTHSKEALAHGDLRTAMSEHRHAYTVLTHLPPNEQAAKRQLITDLYGQIKARMGA